jgi:hypothetical protein
MFDVFERPAHGKGRGQWASFDPIILERKEAEPLIRKQAHEPTDDHPCKKYWSRPYDPGTLWVWGIDNRGDKVWV